MRPTRSKLQQAMLKALMLVTKALGAKKNKR